jgi:hypothetical protein
VGAAPQAVGKRVFCSNRYQHSGCGRTIQLYLAVTVRYLHHAGSAVAAFVLALIAGTTIERAYRLAIGATTPRHAYRWLQRLGAQTSAYRSVAHRPAWQDSAAPTRSPLENRSTPMWKIRSDLAKIVRRLIRQGYDGSEAGHSDASNVRTSSTG